MTAEAVTFSAALDAVDSAAWAPPTWVAKIAKVIAHVVSPRVPENALVCMGPSFANGLAVYANTPDSA